MSTSEDTVTPSPSAHGIRRGHKTFIPLENNPTVMNPLAHILGLDPTLRFVDVYSLSEPALLALVPRPALALLFTFPITPASESAWPAEDAPRPLYAASGPAEPVTWFAQTIGHACGLIALLHCVANVDPAEQAVVPGSTLEKLLAAATPLAPAPRARLLYDSAALEDAHMAAARQGDSVVPSAAEEPGNGFVAFVRGRDGHLWELEGRRKGPLDRGVMGEGEDLLTAAVVARGPGVLVERESKVGGSSRFSCLALVRAQDE